MQNFLDIGGLRRPSPAKKRCLIVKGKKTREHSKTQGIIPVRLKQRKLQFEVFNLLK